MTFPRGKTAKRINVGISERGLSMFGGTMLLLYLARNRNPAGALAGLLGAALLYRGISGQDPLYTWLGVSTAGTDHTLYVEKAMTINRPRQEVYAYWRTLENLPRFMEHVKSIESMEQGRSHWVVHISPDITLDWDAQITEDRTDERIAWQSLPGSSVQHEGSVRFVDAPGDRGTEVTMALTYRPPAGAAGMAVERLHQVVTAQQIQEDLRRFKQILETGERLTVEGQPAGS